MLFKYTNAKIKNNSLCEPFYLGTSFLSRDREDRKSFVMNIESIKLDNKSKNQHTNSSHHNNTNSINNTVNNTHLIISPCTGKILTGLIDNENHYNHNGRNSKGEGEQFVEEGLTNSLKFKRTVFN